MLARRALLIFLLALLSLFSPRPAAASLVTRVATHLPTLDLAFAVSALQRVWAYDGARLVVKVSDGSIVEQIKYDPWGAIESQPPPSFQPFAFAGGLYDADTQLLRFGARDYDPATGRWTAKDPILFLGGDANLYAYCSNDPVNCLDPSGLTPGECYASPLDAALHALSDYNFQSIAIDREFAGLIYRKAGHGGACYSYTQAKPGTASTSNPLSTRSQMQAGDEICGDFHTHASYHSPTDEFFSPRDMMTADALGSSLYFYRGYTSYLATPSGRIGIYKGDQNPLYYGPSSGYGVP